MTAETAKLGPKCVQYAAERYIDEDAMTYAGAADATRSPLPRVIAAQPCVYVPAQFPDGDSGAVDLGGQFVFCDSDLSRWRNGHPERSGDIASKRTLSRAERPFADRSGFCVGLDKLPQIAADAKRRNVRVVVVLAEGISDYLTALTVVEPAYPWRDAAQCVVAAVGVGQLVATAQAAWALVAGAGAHLVVIAHDDSGSADQGAQRSIDAVLRWRSLGGNSARLLVCRDDLSADWRADDRGALAAVYAACDDRGGLDIVPVPGADIDYLSSLIVERTRSVRSQPQPARCKPRCNRVHRGNASRGSRQPFATFEDVAAALSAWGAVSDGAGGWRARCPAHNGSKRSLSLSCGDDGRPLLFCHSRQCDYEAILRSLSLWAGTA